MQAGLTSDDWDGHRDGAGIRAGKRCLARMDEGWRCAARVGRDEVCTCVSPHASADLIAGHVTFRMASSRMCSRIDISSSSGPEIDVELPAWATTPGSMGVAHATQSPYSSRVPPGRSLASRAPGP